ADFLLHFRRNPINSNNVFVEQFLLVRLHFQLFSYNRPYKIQTTKDPLCACPDWSCEQGLCGFSGALQEEPNQQQQRGCRTISLSQIALPSFLIQPPIQNSDDE